MKPATLRTPDKRVTDLQAKLTAVQAVVATLDARELALRKALAEAVDSDTDLSRIAEELVSLPAKRAVKATEAAALAAAVETAEKAALSRQERERRQALEAEREGLVKKSRTAEKELEELLPKLQALVARGYAAETRVNRINQELGRTDRDGYLNFDGVIAALNRKVSDEFNHGIDTFQMELTIPPAAV